MFVCFSGYVQYLLQNHPDLIFECVTENLDVRTSMKKKLFNEKVKTTMRVKDCAELLVGEWYMTQRSYLKLKQICAESNILLSSYGNASKYYQELNVGEISFNKHFTPDVCKNSECMHASTSVCETLSLIFSTNELYEKASFVTTEQQFKLFSYLKKANSELYGNLKSSCRTIFIRDTGDNFRASKNFPTEQISFSVSNIGSLIHSPYGQFATSLYRGSENRKVLECHGKAHFDEFCTLIHDGIELSLPDGSQEHFNVIVLLVTDLGYIKEVIGKCSSTGYYGCYHCTKRINDWNAAKPSKAKPQSVKQFVVDGSLALQKLGKNPDKGSSKYTDFQHKHFGQWVSLMIYAMYFFLVNCHEFIICCNLFITNG